MLLLLAFFAAGLAINVETFYADSTCSGPVAYAEHTPSFNSFCTPSSCSKAIGSAYYVITSCPNPPFFTLGVDARSFEGIACAGATQTITTYPLAPACGGSLSQWSCNSTTVFRKSFGNITCSGPSVDSSFPTNACVQAGSKYRAWTCNTPTATTPVGGTRAPGAGTVVSISVALVALLALII